MHDKYLQIFNIYFSQEKKAGFFAKLFGIKRKKELSSEEVESAKKYYEEMEKVSKALLEEINRLERRLVAVSQEKIKGLI